jgi:hypothetical protein
MNEANNFFEKVGRVHTYKDIEYKMMNGGLYCCIGLQNNEALSGYFTSPNALHLAIDMLERKGKLPKKNSPAEH